MTQQSRAIFSRLFHFATAFMLSLPVAFAAPGLNYRNFDIADYNPHRPPTLIEIKPATLEKWKNYLDWLSTQSEDQIKVAKEFQWIQRLLVFQMGTAQFHNLIDVFREKRSVLPTEIRWLLAAVEIQSKYVATETFEDAKSAIRHITITESSSFLGVGGGIDPKILYRGVRKSKGQEPEIIELYSLTDLAKLHRAWHEVAILEKDFQSDDILEKKRIRWLEAVAKMTSYFRQSEVLKIIKDFEAPQMRIFTSQENHEFFLQVSIGVMKKFGLKYGEISFNQHGDVNFAAKGDSKDGFTTMRSLVKKWLAENLNYNIKYYTQLSRDQLIDIDTLTNRPVSAKDREVLAHIIEQKKLNPDSLIAAALIWMKQQGDVDHKIYREAVAIAYNALITDALVVHGAIKVSNATLEGTHLAPEEYSKFLALFYSMMTTNQRLTPEQAQKLLTKQSLKLPGESEEAWQKIEWTRYLALQRSIPQEILLEHLIQVTANEIKSELFDRTLAGEFIRTRIKPKNLEEIARRVKTQAQGIKSSAYKGTDNKVWEKNSAELVTVIRALDPADAEMHIYLSSIYAGRNFDGPIAGQTALSLIAESGLGNEDLKKEILQRLQYVTAGDSVGTFKSLIKLFPDAGAEIMEVIYRHRGAPEKIKPMLFALIDECISNPALLESIKTGLANSPNRTAAKALYQNLELDAWLVVQINRKKETQMSAVNSCKGQLNGKK